MKNCNNPTKNIEIDRETVETVHHNNINATDPLVLWIAVEQVVQKWNFKMHKFSTNNCAERLDLFITLARNFFIILIW